MPVRNVAFRLATSSQDRIHHHRKKKDIVQVKMTVPFVAKKKKKRFTSEPLPSTIVRSDRLDIQKPDIEMPTALERKKKILPCQGIKRGFVVR